MGGKRTARMARKASGEHIVEMRRCRSGVSVSLVTPFSSSSSSPCLLLYSRRREAEKWLPCKFPRVCASVVTSLLSKYITWRPPPSPYNSVSALHINLHNNTTMNRLYLPVFIHIYIPFVYIPTSTSMSVLQYAYIMVLMCIECCRNFRGVTGCPEDGVKVAPLCFILLAAILSSANQKSLYQKVTYGKQQKIPRLTAFGPVARRLPNSSLFFSLSLLLVPVALHLVSTSSVDSIPRLSLRQFVGRLARPLVRSVIRVCR